jgi:uncharacterized protein (DUF58 family)
MEWAAAQSVWIWRDGSASMRYRSTENLPEKLAQADLLTMALAALLIRGGERVALLGGGMTPSTSRAALGRMAQQLTRGDLPPANLPAFELLPRHGQLVCISDFLSPLPEIDRALRQFAAQGLHGHLLQILDPAEETLPFTGRVRFAGLEGEGEMLLSRVDTVLREAYTERMRLHQEGLAALARSVGWSFSLTRTDRPPQSALLSLYMLMSAHLTAGSVSRG